MKNAMIYIHGKGGTAAEAAHYQPLFAHSDVIGFDYKAQTPWEAKAEFSQFFDAVQENHETVSIIASSIGAFFALNGFLDKPVKSAHFISPVVNMEQLIADMMEWANVTEEELRVRREIKTALGETLSWNYLCYVREHPITWQVPTRILYGEKDHLTAYETMLAFAKKTGAEITVMDGGEHWFHTGEQMAFLDRWIRQVDKI
ncbi:MAG: alpha/beta hydrolase [Eubacteriales bacterium]|nr:alpha/beta hydrolase [Eubacteriales bacterium]